MKYLFCIITILLSASFLYAENKFELTIGEVRIQSQSSSSWQNAGSGQKVRTGDTVKTGKKSFAMIEADGNRIKIQANTKVKFSQDIIDNKQQSSISLFNGSVHCKMDRLKKSGSGYNVNTAASTCAVRGTEFDVASFADGKTVLQVTEGTVALSGISESVDVSKDQESAVKIGGEPEPVKIIKRQDWEKWADETTADVKGKEKEIIDGCLTKIIKLDEDIVQLEKEGDEAKSKENYFLKSAQKSAEEGDTNNEKLNYQEFDKYHRISYSSQTKAFYQASKIDLIKSVADNAFESSDKNKRISSSYKKIVRLYNSYYEKYIKPVNESKKYFKEAKKLKDKKKEK